MFTGNRTPTFGKGILSPSPHSQGFHPVVVSRSVSRVVA